MIELLLNVGKSRSHPPSGGGVIQILRCDGVELVAHPIDLFLSRLDHFLAQ